MLGLERLAQERIVEQVDLADRAGSSRRASRHPPGPGRSRTARRSWWGPPTYTIRAAQNVLAAELLSDDRRPLDERGELLLHHPARRLPESAIGIEPELVGRHVASAARGCAPPRPAADSALNAFTSMTPAPSSLSVGNSFQKRRSSMPRLANSSTICEAREIAHERVEVPEVAHGRERAARRGCRSRRAPRSWPRSLDRPVHALVEARRRAGVHAAVRLVDLDEVGAGLDERATLGVDDPDEIREQGVACRDSCRRA